MTYETKIYKGGAELTVTFEYTPYRPAPVASTPESAGFADMGDEEVLEITSVKIGDYTLTGLFDELDAYEALEDMIREDMEAQRQNFDRHGDVY